MLTKLKFINFVLLNLAVFASSLAHAGGVLNFGYAVGGDTLAERSDGQALHAGDGLILEGGFVAGEASDPVVYQFTGGFKFDSLTGQTSAGDATAKVNSNPLSAIAILQRDRWSFGAGLAYYLNPSYTPPGGSKIKFDNALGLVLEIDYSVHSSRGLYLGFRLTDVTFKSKELLVSGSGFTNEVDANSAAIFVGFRK